MVDRGGYERRFGYDRREEELDAKGKPLIDWVKPVKWLLPKAEAYEEWEEDEVDEDLEIIDLYDSENKNGNGSEDSDEVDGEEQLDMETDESEGEYDEEEEAGEDEEDESEGAEEGEYPGAVNKPEDEDVDITGVEESDPLNLRGRGAPVARHLSPVSFTARMLVKVVSMPAHKRLGSAFLVGP